MLPFTADQGETTKENNVNGKCDVFVNPLAFEILALIFSNLSCMYTISYYMQGEFSATVIFA